MSRSNGTQSLLIAFRAEVGVIREMLRSPVEHWLIEVTQGTKPSVFGLPLPHTVFDANADSLGDLRSPILVEQIVKIFTNVKRALNQRRELLRIEEQKPPEHQFAYPLRDRHYAWLCAVAFSQATIVDMKLRRLTRDVVEEDFKTAATQEDQDDSEVAEKLLERMTPEGGA